VSDSSAVRREPGTAGSRGAAPKRERYSPERAYRPLVSPPSVEDKDACAIYAAVR